MIRQAIANDLDAIYELCLEAHSKSPYGEVPHDELEAKMLFSSIILEQFAWIVNDGSGVLLAYKQPLWFNSEKTVATDLVFYVRSSGRGNGVRLARQYIRWAADADQVCLSMSFGGDMMERTEKFYEKMGFSRIGGVYLYGGN